MNVIEDAIALTPGELANNGMLVQGLQKLLTGSETNLTVLSRVVKDMQDSKAWCAFSFHKHPDQVFQWSAADFRKFIEAPRPAGCQTPLHVLERLLRETDAWEVFLELTRGNPGGANNLNGTNQYTKEEVVKCDNITLDHPIEPIKKPPTGTSVSYTLRRLKKGHPDLYEQVKAQEMSAHAAAVEAGFIEKQITVPADPRKAARRLVRHFTREQFGEMVDEALKFYMGN